MIRNNKGVTLVELLIVIVILGIIAAISIPAVGNIVDNSRRDAVLADAVVLRNSANLCITANDCEDGEFTSAAPGSIDTYFDSGVDYWAVTITGGQVTQVAIANNGLTYIGASPQTANRNTDVVTITITVGGFDFTGDVFVADPDVFTD